MPISLPLLAAIGLPDADVTLTRRAGLLHDIGGHGIPATIWDKPGPLTTAERERIRLHLYYTERMLARSAMLAVGIDRRLTP